MSKVYPATSLIGGIAGSLDNIDGTALADKDVAIVTVQDGNMYPYVLDEDSAEAENSPYIISPDANAGDKRWKLVGVQPAFSHVRANRSTVQSISALDTMIYNVEVHDDLSEYDDTTGVFTATYAGLYQVNASFLFNSYAWTQGKFCEIDVYVEGLLVDSGYRTPIEVNTTALYGGTVSTVVKLAATDIIELVINHNYGSAINTLANSNLNRMTIDRIV